MFEAARVRDRSDLPVEIREALEEADRQMAERWKGKLPPPKVIDMRTKDHGTPFPPYID